LKGQIWGAICLSLAASIWGGMYVVSKYVLDYIPPFTLLWLRYVIAFVVLALVLIVWKREPFPRSGWRFFFLIGFTGYFLSVGAQFVGTKLSDAHTGAVVTSAAPAFIVLFARILLKEPLTWRKLVALLLSTLGVILVIGWTPRTDNSFLGGLFLLGAALTWGLLSVFAKQASAYHSTLVNTTYALFLAIVFTTPVMGWEQFSGGWEAAADAPLLWWGVLYLGVISTAGAFFLWNKGMELMEAGAGSLFFFFQPLVGTFLGWLLLDEQLGVNFFIGGTLICLGVLIVTRQSRSSRPS
jgi:drug/metabolite transporter (DMT)-like permease